MKKRFLFSVVYFIFGSFFYSNALFLDLSPDRDGSTTIQTDNEENYTLYQASLIQTTITPPRPSLFRVNMPFFFPRALIDQTYEYFQQQTAEQQHALLQKKSLHWTLVSLNKLTLSWQQNGVANEKTYQQILACNWHTTAANYLLQKLQSQPTQE